MIKTTHNLPQKRNLNAEDLFNLRLATSVSISPGETKIAYTVERMDKKENKYFSNIYIYNLTLKQNRHFTYGNHNDGEAVWSPDSRQIAFISFRNKKTGIYLMPVTGGAEKQLIELDGAISNLSWAPDGKHLVFSLRYNDSHFIKDEKKKKEPPVYRHITRLFYRLDGAGFLPKDVFNIYKLNVKNGTLTKLTKSKRDNSNPSISPDGRWVTYISNRAKDPDMNSLYYDLFIIPFKGGKEKLVPTPPGPIASPKFSPDSKTIACIAHDNPDDEWGVTNFHVWKVGINGKPKARDLMPKYDRMAFDQSISDTSDIHDISTLFWSADGKRIYFLSSDTGATNLYYVPSSGGKPTSIFKGKCHIKGYSFNGKTKTVALLYADMNNPGDIITCPSQYGGEKKAEKHTDLNQILRIKIRLSKTKEVRFKSFDGTEVQGWLVFPPKFNPDKKYPSILEIHGGPRVQYAYTFFHEMQYLA
ncbi:MAG: S9 family peptidase, partial [Candidatus Zixiibacteriota bacterium]